MCCGRGRKKPENKKPKFHLVLSPRFLPAPCSAEGTGGSPPAIAPPAGSHPPTPPLTLMFLGGGLLASLSPFPSSPVLGGGPSHPHLRDRAFPTHCSCWCRRSRTFLQGLRPLPSWLLWGPSLSSEEWIHQGSPFPPRDSTLP